MPRNYEEICGLARGLDVVGERWTLLIVRELLFGPKRFTDLLDGLPGIPPSLLSARLKEMQMTGVISKTVLPPPAASAVYQLTDAGKALEGILYALGRWGAQFGRMPRPTDVVRTEWILFALRSVFQPDIARGVHAAAELRLPEGTMQMTVNDGTLTVGMGSAPSPDVLLTGERSTVLAVLMGRAIMKDAVQSGQLKIQGDRKVLGRLIEIFRVPGVRETASALELQEGSRRS